MSFPSDRTASVRRFTSGSSTRWGAMVFETREPPHIVVFGDLIVDYWLADEASRAGEIESRPRRYSHVDLGGAANTAANAAALGARVTYVGCVPDSALSVIPEMEKAGVTFCRISGCLADTAGARFRLRVDGGLRRRKGRDAKHNHKSVADDVRVAMALLSADAVIVSDYGQEDTGALVQLLSNMRRSVPTLVVDTASPHTWAGVGVDVLKMNHREYAHALSTSSLSAAHDGSGEADDGIGEEAASLASLLNCALLAVSSDVHGVYLFDSERQVGRTHPGTISEEDATVGAGDLFVAAITLHLACGIGPVTAASLAQAAVDFSLGPRRTVRFGRSNLYSDDQFARVKPRSVFTNGCFDLIHGGHLSLLSYARKIADFVVVGLNSDESIRELKGPSRPVLPFEWRKETLEGLGLVDRVIELDGISPVPLVEKFRPNIYLKGGDYSRVSLPFFDEISPLVDSIEFTPLVSGRSSSLIADRVLTRPGN
ncbi:PfkB family carbohydrate kinase [Microbacterium sp. Ag1]|uniref:PfkB family carbohydrate kinase n=1 Tax=Microbacterium sp. Ag1 TaxID=1643443 RepID=UPI0009E23440|nr:PfkB family carbohydrate kinase [Microbacterium sp. Ag1]